MKIANGGNILLVMVFVLLGCNGLKKLQKKEGFSDKCFQSYEFFKSHLLRAEDGMLEFANPVEQNYEYALVSYTENSSCWFETLSERAVMQLFGTPHDRTTNQRTQVITVTYFIRSKNCMELNDFTQDCGMLKFSFSKDGIPYGGIFHALNARRID